MNNFLRFFYLLTILIFPSFISFSCIFTRDRSLIFILKKYWPQDGKNLIFNSILCRFLQCKGFINLGPAEARGKCRRCEWWLAVAWSEWCNCNYDTTRKWNKPWCGFEWGCQWEVRSGGWTGGHVWARNCQQTLLRGWRDLLPLWFHTVRRQSAFSESKSSLCNYHTWRCKICWTSQWEGQKYNSKLYERFLYRHIWRIEVILRLMN